MNNVEFAEKARKIAIGYDTSYMLGGIGQRVNAVNLDSLLRQYPSNDRFAPAAREIYGVGYVFDCCGLVKAILWGWTPDYSTLPYLSNRVPDLNEYGLLQQCADISDDFSNVQIGEFLWMDGHCGVYLGNGLAVESTPAFDGGVQITNVFNVLGANIYPSRTWTKHGKLPYVMYTAIIPTPGNKAYIALNELGYGSVGKQVKALQQILIVNGFDCGPDGADGDFGDSTLNAVLKYQAANSCVCGEADGIVGQKTWGSLLGTL